MRLGLLIYGSLDTLSGGYLYDRQLVEYLRRQGDQVEVISIPWRNYAAHLLDNFSSALLQRLAALPVDLLIQDELNHPSLFRLNEHVRRSVRYPIVSLVHHLRSQEHHHPDWLLPLYRQIEQRYLSGVDHFIFNSQTTQESVAALRPALPTSVVVTPGGDRFKTHLDPAQIRRRALAPGPLRLLYIGSLTERKGLHVLLEALGELRKTLDWHLTVAGRLDVAPGYAAKMGRLAAAFGQRVRFAGALDDPALQVELEASHVLVVPSFYEGFGIVYLEGMAFGLPALATTGGAAAEIICDGETGCLLSPGDSAGLAQQIASLAEDRERLAWMSMKARLRYLTFPTWEESMEKARGFLCSLAT